MEKETEKEIVKLVNVLKRIARAAGYAAWIKSDPEAARFCVAQYNKVLSRLGQLETGVKPLFTPLTEDASPEVMRMAARELLAYLEVDAPEVHVWGFAGRCVPREWRARCFPLSVRCD